jgi:diacylglycerol kinase (CTP)
VTWALEGGVRAAGQHLGGGGWAGLALIGLVAGVVSGVAEALGKFFNLVY